MADPGQQAARCQERLKRTSWLKRLRLPKKKDLGASSLSVVTHEPEEQESPPKKTYKSLPIPEPCDELEIRLVHLQPRAIAGDNIQCKLTTRNLVGNSYEALSYEWGSVLPELLINMDGVMIPVRENLWWALHYLQLDDEPRVLWIDALCINQNDTDERNYQVSRMDYIYRSARRCIAWIGKEEIRPDLEPDDGSLAMEFINRANPDQGKTKPPLTLSIKERREHDSLEYMCRRRYWSRLWIIQEIALSKSVLVQCGSHCVPWTSLRYIFNNLKSCVHASYQFSITSSAPFRLSQAAIDQDGRKKSPLALPLADLTLKFKGSQCEDPRDTVFGLLGLTFLCCRDAVPADYSMAAEQLCNSLLIHHVAYHLDLESFCTDSAVAADIRDVCFAVTSTSTFTRELEYSIASLSMKARRSVWPSAALSRMDRGRVILSLCAIDLTSALRAPEALEYRRYMSGTTSAALTSPLNAPVVDLRKIVTERLIRRPEYWIAEHYHETADWEKQRESLATAKKVTSRRLTHIFLTDTGYSGITTADTRVGDAAFSEGQFNLKVSFESDHTQNNPPKPSRLHPGICIDAETTFQELLSWLK